MTESDSTKRCSRCGQWFPAMPEHFYRNSKVKSGLTAHCKECGSAYFREHYRKNAERKRAVVAEYRRTNREVVLAGKRKSWYAHHERNLERAREWQRNNRGICNQLTAEWRRKNIEKAREIQRHAEQRRRVHKRRLAASFTLEQWIVCVAYFEGRCAYCGATKKLEQDHFVALSRGGEYVAGNVLPACKSCNSSKGARDFAEWYPVQPFYSADRAAKVLEYRERCLPE